MTYKTILVHVDQSRHAAARIKIAAEIAIAENAHLVGAAFSGISRYIYADSAIDLSGSVVVAQLDAMRDRNNKSLAEFDALAKKLGVTSFEKRLVDDEPEGGLALQARYADLVVVSQIDLDETGYNMVSDLSEYVMLNCARPVLIIPFAGKVDKVGNNVLIAWDGSAEATRAITNAIPLLKRAKNVVVTVFNPSKQIDAHGEQPGADIALYLARHNIKIEVAQKHTAVDVGNALLSMVADLQSDLIVMGGFGHTRFREILLGGVTNTILKAMTVPVLISH